MRCGKQRFLGMHSYSCVCLPSKKPTVRMYDSALQAHSWAQNNYYNCMHIVLFGHRVRHRRRRAGEISYCIIRFGEHAHVVYKQLCAIIMRLVGGFECSDVDPWTSQFIVKRRLMDTDSWQHNDRREGGNSRINFLFCDIIYVLCLQLVRVNLWQFVKKSIWKNNPLFLLQN